MSKIANNYVLYWITSVIWGSTWYAIHLQLGVVPPMWSIVYRFTFAGLILLSYCLLTGVNLRFTKRQHGFLALQGLLLFSVNYIIYYFASSYLVSGMIALIFALIVVMNIIHCRIFFKTPITPRVVVASVMGFLGLGLVFWSESGQWLAQSKTHGEVGIFLGVFLAALGTFVASLGNMVAVYNKKQHIPIVASNTLGILYGAGFTWILTLLTGQPMAFDGSLSYLGSLVYLSLIGTVLAFGTYVVLISRIGADKGGYVFVTTPIVALFLSTYYEAFHWSLWTVIGVLAVLSGNLLVLKPGEQKGLNLLLGQLGWVRRSMNAVTQKLGLDKDAPAQVREDE